MADGVSEEIALLRDAGCFALDDQITQRHHGLADGDDEDGGFVLGVFGIQFAHMIVHGLEVVVMRRVEIGHRFAIAIHDLAVEGFAPERAVIKGHPKLLHRDAELRIVLQAELHEVFDACVRQEDGR